MRKLRAISHSDRKSDDLDAPKLARYARLERAFGLGTSALTEAGAFMRESLNLQTA